MNSTHHADNSSKVIIETCTTISNFPWMYKGKPSNLLKCCFLNVCGLKSKLLSHDFEIFLSDFDMIALTETKLNDLDTIDDFFTHFDVLCTNRKCAKRTSGGVALLTKKHLSKHIQELKCTKEYDILENDFTLWVKIVGLLETDIILGIVYIPPESSVYSSTDMFDTIENQLLSFNDPNNVYCLLGDFNARSKNLNEIIHMDQYVTDAPDDSDFCQIVENSCIPIARNSKDVVCNNYGRRLIELCSSMGLIIANGRCGTDKISGSNTCDDISLIDYVLCSPRLFVNISEFQVLPFCSLLSDKHSPVQFSFIINKGAIDATVCSNSNNCTDNNAAINCREIVKWSSDKKDLFVNNLDLEDVHSIESSLIELSNHNKEMSQTDVDSIVLRICNVFDLSAIKCKIRRNVHEKKNKRKTQVKPWFNDKCEVKRKTFFQAKADLCMNDSDENKKKLKSCSKDYKCQLRTEHRLYHIALNKKIQDLSTTDPKAYWKLINSGIINDSTSPDNQPSTADFREHFRKLNDGPVIPEIVEVNLMDGANQYPKDLLDKPISSEEILKCISHLKNNKAILGMI